MTAKPKKAKTTVDDLVTSAENYKTEYVKKLMKCKKSDIIDESMKTALVLELPFSVERIDRLQKGEVRKWLAHISPDDLSYDMWDDIMIWELEPRYDGNYDLFETEDDNCAVVLKAQIERWLKESGRWH